MKRIDLNIVLLSLGLMLSAIVSSCGKLDAEASLRQAESEIKHGNVDVAASTCNILSDTTEAKLSSTQLCRVAIIYAKISEISDNLDYMASATECFDRAIDLDTDSLNNYIETLDMEDQNYVRIIREVAHALNNPMDYGDADDGEFADYDFEKFIQGSAVGDTPDGHNATASL